MPLPADATARLSALRVLDHGAYVREVRAALVASPGLPEAAERLGIPERTLYRWIDRDATLAAGITLPGVGGAGHRDNLASDQKRQPGKRRVTNPVTVSESRASAKGSRKRPAEKRRVRSAKAGG